MTIEITKRISQLHADRIADAAGMKTAGSPQSSFVELYRASSVTDISATPKDHDHASS